MGLKFTDILIKGHQHEKLMAYFRQSGFEDFLDETPTSYQWKTESFPLQKSLGIETHDICLWEAEDLEHKLVIESNQKTPWIRVALAGSIDLELNCYELSEACSAIDPNAHICIFHYYSVVDGASVWIYKNGVAVRSISWDCKTPQVKWSDYDLNPKEESISLSEEMRKNVCGESLIRFYWRHLFPEIPIRYLLVGPNEDFEMLLSKHETRG